MKKIFALGLSAAALTFISTGSAHAEAFNGSHVGISVGMDNLELNAKDVIYDGDTFDGLSGNGAAFGVYTGYDFAVGDGVFVGLESFLDLSNAEMKYDDGDGYKLSIKTKNAFGITGRFGAKLNDSTGAYARIGWAKARFKGTDGEDTASYNERGILYGIGLETALGQTASLRAEYMIANYGSVGATDGQLKAKNGQFRLGFGFNF